MKLFRRKSLYLVWSDERRAYTFDAASSLASADFDPSELIHREGRRWLPVLDDEPLPEGLIDRLILKWADGPQPANRISAAISLKRCMIGSQE